MPEPTEADRIAANRVLGQMPTAAIISAYCVRCKSQTRMQNPRIIAMKNGKPAARRHPAVELRQGECAGCGGGVFKIGGIVDA